MRGARKRRGPGARHLVIGAVLGVLLLHPVMELIYWVESPGRLGEGAGGLGYATLRRLLTAFTPGMLPMTGFFALLGGAIGAAFRWLAPQVNVRSGSASPSAEDLAGDVAAILVRGESELAEFKASLRWDAQMGRVNRALEEAVARTIAGFLNHRGGVLLIGVTDTAAVVGLELDYLTLRRRDRDGCHQFLMGLVESRLGGHVCAQVHVGFAAVQGVDVCRIVVEASPVPVYYQDGRVARYLVRSGNGTRELDAREAIAHVAARGAEAERRPPGRA